MNFLVVGRHPHTRQLVRMLRKIKSASASHLPSTTEAIAATSRGGFHFDLVFLEDRDGNPRTQDVAEAIEAVDPGTPIAFLRNPVVAGAGGRSPRLVGAFEHSSRGLRLIESRLSGAPARPSQRLLPAPAEILFEFHAPCSGKDGSLK